MTTLTHRTPPAPIRAYLNRKGTTAHHADARITQVFYPGLGWSSHLGQPFPSPSAIRVLRDRGITAFAISFNEPRHGLPRWRKRTRLLADFTVNEVTA